MVTQEEYQRELEEAERLEREIHSVISQINRVNLENSQLEAELNLAVQNVYQLIRHCTEMDQAVNEDMGYLSGYVGQADLRTREVFQAIHELMTQYFAFKNISTASKNVTQFNDEYYTRFANYHELRRISLGYVVGLDSCVISSDTLRKKVEKAYLQNTDYWLAYAISAVMLWAGNEREAAQRALEKSLSMHYFHSCLFFLLINLRFQRMEAARKWYVNYLDRADPNHLGDDWQYLLQAYLSGSFGFDPEFQTLVAGCFQKMLVQTEATTVDFAQRFTRQAAAFAEVYVHKTQQEYVTLWRTCSEYGELKALLSTAEKNAQIAQYYDKLAAAGDTSAEELPQRIENVLYSLISHYDEEEWKVVQKIKYNEAVIQARGDLAIAQAGYRAMYEGEETGRNLGDLLLQWAFADASGQVDASVRRFSISFMKEAIQKGLEQFAEQYRAREKQAYTFTIDGCRLECGEADRAKAEEQLDQHYDKNKWKDTFRDKYIRIYTGICAGSLLLLLLLIVFFSPVLLTFGILAGIAGSFLLWRRLVDMGKLLKEKKRKGKLLLNRALDELAEWRAAYRAADAQHAGLLRALETLY